MKLKLIVPAALLALAGVTACSSPQSPATSPAANQQAAGGQDKTAGAGAKTDDDDPEDKGGDTKEEPLTGDLKRKAEKAALKEFPGKVLKSEHDAERPGLYAVEIEQKSGGEVEVYLDTDFNVVGTKDESGDKD